MSRLSFSYNAGFKKQNDNVKFPVHPNRRLDFGVQVARFSVEIVV